MIKYKGKPSISELYLHIFDISTFFNFVTLDIGRALTLQMS